MIRVPDESLNLILAAIVMIPAWLMLLLSFCFRKVRWPLRFPAILGIVGYVVGYVELQISWTSSYLTR